MATTVDGDIRIPVGTDTDVVTARKEGRELARELGFSPTDATLLATAISEVTRNIISYAGRGAVSLGTLDDRGRRGVRVVASDSGPGIQDVDEALEDGFSTGPGMGIGLPGARRLTDEFEVRSVPGEGTTVTMVKWGSSGA